MRDDFQDIVGRLDYPMLVVTAVAGTGADPERSGCLVGFSTQCSLDPPLYAVWISQANRTHEVAAASDHLVLHFLSEAERHLAELFGQETGDEVDKFSHCAWRPGPGGVPILEGCSNWVVGRVLDRRDSGDHTLMVVEPIEAHSSPFTPLGFQAVRSLEPGHPA